MNPFASFQSNSWFSCDGAWDSLLFSPVLFHWALAASANLGFLGSLWTPQSVWARLFKFSFVVLKDFIYLFTKDRERQRHSQREKQAPCREPDAGLDPGTWDHALSQRQMLNHWAIQASLFTHFIHTNVYQSQRFLLLTTNVNTLSYFLYYCIFLCLFLFTTTPNWILKLQTWYHFTPKYFSVS